MESLLRTGLAPMKRAQTQKLRYIKNKRLSGSTTPADALLLAQEK